MERVADLNWPIYLVCILGMGSINFLVFRRYVFGVLDPWILTLPIEQTIIVGTLAYYTWAGGMLFEHFVYVVIGYLLFVAGLRVFYKKNFRPHRTQTILSAEGLRIAILMLLALLIVNNLAIYYLLGIPTLRSGARTITLYSSLGRGGGVFLYLNISLLILLPILTMKALLVHKQKRLGYVSLLIIILVVLGLGGKTGYLRLLFTFGVSAYYLGRNYKFSIKVPKLAWVALVLVLGWVLYSFVNVAQSGYEASAILAFIRRLVNTAAGPYYYFIRHSYLGFSGLNPLSYHFSQIIPYLGYRDLEAMSLGVNLTLHSDLKFGTPGFGPNPTMYVIGHIAWQRWGVFYCFIIGLILSFIRYQVKTGFIVYVALNTLVGSLTMDGTLLPLYLFYLLVLSPSLCAAAVISGSVRRERKTPGLISKPGMAD